MKILITGHSRGIGASCAKVFNDGVHKEIIGCSRSNGYDISDLQTRKNIVQLARDCDIIILNAFSDEVKYAQHELLVDMFNEYEKELKYEKRKYAKNHPHLTDLSDIIKKVKPTVLVGTSGQGQKFNRHVISALSQVNKRPRIFALSNPTSKSECTAEEAYKWSSGKAIFASGSPFAPVKLNKDVLYPSQGNNVYIFPGVGLGSVLTGSEQIPKSFFLTAAKTLSDIVSTSELDQGLIYPTLKRVREVSSAIAVKIIKKAKSEGHSKLNLPKDVENYIKNYMYSPKYD